MPQPRTKVLFLTFALTLLGTFAPIWGQNRLQACDSSPVLYSEDGFRGSRLDLSTNIQNLGNRGFGDRASSICVPQYWTVVLFEDDSFRGDRLELRGPIQISDLRRDRPQGQDWGDRVSSLQVSEQRPPAGRADCAEYPILYSEDGFRGSQLRLDQNVTDLHRRGFGDRASSICVPQYWTVILFEDNSFRGDRLELSGPTQIADLKRDRPQGQDWGDRASSLQSTERRPVSGRAGCERNPVLYSNDDFGGSQLQLSQDVQNLGRRGFGDRASSICVPRNWTVILYEDDGYRGSRIEINGPTEIADLRRDRPQGQDWGDRASSVKVSERRSSNSDVDCGRSATLFSEADFRGNQLQLDQDVEDLHRSGFGDRASSICVPQGWTITLYENTRFRGARLQIIGPRRIDLRRDRPQGQDWGDRASSLRVSRPRGFRLPF